jgi:hypothetical protein
MVAFDVGDDDHTLDQQHRLIRDHIEISELRLLPLPLDGTARGPLVLTRQHPDRFRDKLRCRNYADDFYLTSINSAPTLYWSIGELLATVACRNKFCARMKARRVDDREVVIHEKQAALFLESTP